MDDPESLLPFDLQPGGPFVLVLVLVLAGSLVVRGWAMRRWKGSAERAALWVERWILTISILAMVVLSALQIVLRNFFDSGLLWIDPLLRALVLWLAFLGAVAATRQGRHIAIDVVSRFLPARGREILQRTLSLIASGVCVALANGAFGYLQLEKEFPADAFLGLQTWQVQSILLIGFVLLAYRFLQRAVHGAGSDAETETS